MIMSKNLFDKLTAYDLIIVKLFTCTFN